MTVSPLKKRHEAFGPRANAHGAPLVAQSCGGECTAALHGQIVVLVCGATSAPAARGDPFTDVGPGTAPLARGPRD